MAQFCTKCGSEILPGARFCNKCGNPVENGPEESNPVQSVPSPAEQEKPAGSNNKLVIAIIAAVLLIGGIGGYMLFGRSSDDKKSVAQSQPIKTEQKAKSNESVQAPKSVEEKTGFIIGTNVNAREKASTDSANVGTFALGEKVVVLIDEPEWAKVRRSDGKECYVFKKFLGDQAALDKRQAKYNVKDGPYPVYLNGNPDYVLLYGHMGTAWYVVKSSLHRSKTSRTAINIAAVSDADKGNTNISSIKTYNYWFNDVGLSYWFNDNPNNQYGADLGTKDVGAIVALSGYEAACYIRNQYKANPKHFPKVFYDRLNP